MACDHAITLHLRGPLLPKINYRMLKVNEISVPVVSSNWPPLGLNLVTLQPLRMKLGNLKKILCCEIFEQSSGEWRDNTILDFDKPNKRHS